MAVGHTKLPAYRHHKPSGQAVVTLSGRDIYLGPHGTRPSRDNYDRVVGEWLANGRTMPGLAAGAASPAVAKLVNAFHKAKAFTASQTDAYKAVMSLLGRVSQLRSRHKIVLNKGHGCFTATT